MDYDDDREDLPAHVLKVTRLFPEEEPAVAVSLQLTRDELEEAPVVRKCPPYQMMNNQILLKRSWNLNLMKTLTTRQSRTV